MDALQGPLGNQPATPVESADTALTADQQVHAKLEAWRRQLIDFSRRNRLLYFRPASRSILRVVAPEWRNLYTLVVENGSSLPVALPPETEDGDEEPVAVPLRGLQLQVAEGSVRRALRNARSKARTTIQELGLNTLYLSFGLLHWQESEASTETVTSPLILVPVAIEYDPPTDAYTLAPHEDDVVINPALAHWLQTSFGLTPPEPAADGDDNPLGRAAGLTDHLAAWAAVAQPRRGWSVSHDVFLATFSFHKLSLFQELQTYAATAASHPLVRALAGDPGPLHEVLEASDTARPTARPPRDVYQVLDADASQQEAIEAAVAGRSFVLQGPPGTGKSQTIANIVAECLARGRTVLFVSQKMAALEVVHRRLTEAGLDDFCLEVHSHKANKREVVANLNDALAREFDPLDREAPRELDQLLALQTELAAYPAALHRPTGGLRLTPFGALGRLAQLAEAPALSFPYPGALATDAVGLEVLDTLLRELALLHDIVLQPDRHPWHGVRLEGGVLQLQADIQHHFGNLLASLPPVAAASAALAEICGLPAPVALDDVDALLTRLEVLVRTPRPPRGWLVANTLDEVQCEARQLHRAARHAQELWDGLAPVYDGSVLELPHPEVRGALWWSLDDGDGVLAEAVRQARPRLETAARELDEALAQVQTLLPALAAACHQPLPQSEAQLQSLLELADLLITDPQPRTHWFDDGEFARLAALARDGRQRAERARAIVAQVAARYMPAFGQLDPEPLLELLTTRYRRLLSRLGRGWRNQLAELQACLLDGQRLTYAMAVTDLSAAVELARLRMGFRNQAAAHTLDFGGDGPYDERTDWAALEGRLLGSQRIAAQYAPSDVPVALVQTLARPGAIRDQVGPLADRLRASLECATEAWQRLTADPLINQALALPAAIEHTQPQALRGKVSAALARCQPLWAALDRIEPCLRQPRTVVQLGADLVTAEAVASARHGCRTHPLFATYAHGTDLDWDAIRDAINGSLEFRRAWGLEPPAAAVALAAGETDLAALPEELAALREARAALAEAITFTADLFSEGPMAGRELSAMPMASLTERLRAQRDHLAELPRQRAYQQLGPQWQAQGLDPFVRAVCQHWLAADQLAPAFYRRFWSLWLDGASDQEPSLRSFDRARHLDRLSTFRELDQRQVQVARRRLRAELIARRPNLWLDAKSSEPAVLRREAQKKRRHKPLRRLFAEISSLLLRLKPCLMMSPLSVAMLLDPLKVRFDLVVFDEASQVCSEDAVGAIMRGSQTIIVGDSKQLPPTRFFATQATSDYEDEETEDEALGDLYESILDECSAIGLPQLMLRWHYRSRCEDLIAFSNHHFYHNELVTFPSSASGNHQPRDLGVHLVEVPDGRYRRGRVVGGGTNPVEAARVAEVVLEQITRHHGTRSIGVIAFNEAQQHAIEDALLRLRRHRAVPEGYFDEAAVEPFFIKNLETVQGDERDIIVFSVGYGPNEAGKMLMNFGPLNKQGGERRLNVAVTRAKEQVLLVSSIRAEHIDLTRSNARGVALLRAYLDYAARGPRVLGREAEPLGREPESPFEAAVRDALEAEGLVVHCQIGCSGYRLDLGVVDPERPGRYLLGIECDGATYHRAKSVRDRDRLRQEQLERLGWRLHRIWSPDWVRDPRGCVQRVLEAVARASDALKAPARARVQPAPAVARPTLPAAVPRPAPSPPAGASTPARAAAPELPPGARYLDEVELDCSMSWLGFYDVAYDYPEQIIGLINRLVEAEGPIHLRAATRRIVAVWGISRIGSQLLATVEQLSGHGSSNARLQGEFLWPLGVTTPAVRVARPGASPRPIAEIAIEEIAEAVAICLREASSCETGELCTLVARLLGYQTAGKVIRERITAAIAALAAVRLLVVEDGRAQWLG